MESMEEKQDQIVILSNEVEQQHTNEIMHFEECAIGEALEFPSNVAQQWMLFIDQRMETDS